MKKRIFFILNINKNDLIDLNFLDKKTFIYGLYLKCFEIKTVSTYQTYLVKIIYLYYNKYEKNKYSINEVLRKNLLWYDHYLHYEKLLLKQI